MFPTSVLTPKDEAYVINFNVIQSYTSDVHRLQAALNKVNTTAASPAAAAESPASARARFRCSNTPGTALMMPFIFPPHDMLAKEWRRQSSHRRS